MAVAPRSIVHGTHDTVNRICDHPDIKAISFVGSNAAGQYVYQRGSKSGKRVQASPSPQAPLAGGCTEVLMTS